MSISKADEEFYLSVDGKRVLAGWCRRRCPQVVASQVEIKDGIGSDLISNIAGATQWPATWFNEWCGEYCPKHRDV